MTTQLKSPHGTVHLTLGTPLGSLVLAARQGMLASALFNYDPPADAVFAESLIVDGRGLAKGFAGLVAADPCVRVLVDVAHRLQRYFNGDAVTFADVRLLPHGTMFQRSVWQVLRRIGYGEVWTYAQVAQTLGEPHKARAVGQAVGKNPWGVVVPCHRVIGSDGTLRAMAGGMAVKAHLLALEDRDLLSAVTGAKAASQVNT